MKYFRKYSDLFNNMLLTTTIPTQCPIISVILSYDDTRAITLTKKDDSEYRIKQYDLFTFDQDQHLWCHHMRIPPNWHHRLHKHYPVCRLNIIHFLVSYRNICRGNSILCMSANVWRCWWQGQLIGLLACDGEPI